MQYRVRNLFDIRPGVFEVLNLKVTGKMMVLAIKSNNSTSQSVMRASYIVSLRDDNPVVKINSICWK